MSIADLFLMEFLGYLLMTLIDLINLDQWEKSKKYTKHPQGSIAQQKCQLLICS